VKRLHPVGPLAWLACASVLAWARLAPGATAEPGILPLEDFPRETITVETRSARLHRFVAWRADSPRTREQGLMFVRGLDPDQAMIFVYDPPAQVSMWMKNTLIPLDMLFVDADGCVVMVEREARPESLSVISAGRPVALVVEIGGGVAQTLGIGRGDRVTRPEAGWPPTTKACPAGD
jgi:uncharacterized membrane protein (UPF0127 family)